MKITVILCTYNRCQRLRNALESVAALEPPDTNDWELLVVDNHSSDLTRAVVGDFSQRYPGRFRYLFEAQQGKSYALNAGIREARGDILAFIDDDVTAEPTWLKNLTAAMSNEEWAGAGGRILPRWTSSLPRWLPLQSQYCAPLALFDAGPQARHLTGPPFGTNMAFRKCMFEKYGGFRTDLGPNPHNMIRGEDTEFGSRLLAAGERLRYEPSAIVYYPVAEDRLQKNYFLAWWFDKGRADIRELGTPPGARCIHGIPLCLFRRLAVWTLRWMVAVEPSQRLSAKLKVWWLAGEILECHRRMPPPVLGVERPRDTVQNAHASLDRQPQLPQRSVHRHAYQDPISTKKRRFSTNRE